MKKETMYNVIAIIVFIIILIIIWGIIWLFLGTFTAWFIVICIAAVPICLRIWWICEENKAKNYAEAYKSYEKLDLAYFDRESDTLFLKKRDLRIATYLSVVKDSSSYMNYIPEKTHIGAVTSNGITVGGTYKTGGYNQIFYRENGKAKLMYCGNIVKKIVFDSEKMLNEVKNSNIKQFLNMNDEIILQKPADLTVSNIISKTSGIGSSVTWNALQRDLSNTLPSVEKCNKIRNYICKIEY